MTALLLDAAMGTALLDAGLAPGTLPECWLAAAPERIARVHAAHARAGAEVVLTCTFNLAGPRLGEAGMSFPPEDLAARAVSLARAAAPGARIAGAVGPSALPAGSAADWRELHGRAWRALAAAGADLLWAESHWDLAEARVALESARATGLPSVLTFTFREGDGGLAASGGEPALECLETAAAAGAAAVGFNCALPGAPLEPLLVAAARRIAAPLVAKPSAGLPGALATPDAFGAWSRRLVNAGAAWIGGCCGTTAEHLRACARSLDSARP